MTNKCKICDSKTDYFSKAMLLEKYSIKYYRCPDCGFVQTEEPYWLEEAYSRPINVSDTGIMARNNTTARMTSAVLHFCLSPNSQYVDYGGGYGIFVRMMRDRGFDFYRDDKYCANLFANGFDVADSGAPRFELLTAFEVFEHFVSPCEELQKLLQKSDSILFTTEVLPDNPPQPTEWWYYGLDHGQHVSFYTSKSLQHFANKCGLAYYNRDSLHLFTRVKPITMAARFKLATYHRIFRLLDILSRRKSLADSDFAKITGMDIVRL